MKKLLSCLTAGAMLATVVATAAACGGEKIISEAAPAFDDADATLSLTGLDLDDPFDVISDELFGLFLEDINYASYALDDNMISNGSFEYASDRLYGWSASGVTLNARSGSGIFSGNADFTGINPYYAEVAAAAGGSISNEGYDAAPIAVSEGTDYLFSAFISAADYSGTITAEVTDGTTSYGSVEIDVSQDANWIKYQGTITAEGTASKNLVLSVTFGGAGTVLLDSVKLETTDSTVGFKNYIYNVIKDLSPAFFRFPGGCVIEGKNVDSAYDWKNSIGAVKTDGDDKVPAFTYTLVEDGKAREVTTYGEQTTRTPNTDIWQQGNNYYQMEYGIGFYEYFLLCESLNASAIPIVNCGFSCQTQTAGGGISLAGRHGNRIEDYIQDALDLVAFAKGDPDSADENEAYWAGIRKAMGHEEPFEMHYIGIGNEQWGVYYEGYYEKFLERFETAKEENEALYGDVQLIVGNCTMLEHCELQSGSGGVAKDAAIVYRSRTGNIKGLYEYGVVDQHYYINFTDGFRNADLYDNYTRSGNDYYEVFVGEYSANRDEVMTPGSLRGQTVRFTENSWITALSEAAMMTGFERNGDIVRLAAYAPMFGSLLRPNQWLVNMMFFTNTEVVLTPNYFVQQLFMQNAGDHKVDSQLTYAGETPQTTYTTQSGSDITVDDLYYVTSYDKETGDIIVKIVNAGESDKYINIEIDIDGVKLRGYADVTLLINDDPLSVGELGRVPVLIPETKTIGSFTDGNTTGYLAEGYTVSAIRFRTK